MIGQNWCQQINVGKKSKILIDKKQLRIVANEL